MAMIRLTHSTGEDVWVNPLWVRSMGESALCPWEGGEPYGTVLRFIDGTDTHVKERPNEVARLIGDLEMV